MKMYAKGSILNEEGYRGTVMDHTERNVNGEARFPERQNMRCYVIQTMSGQESILMNYMDQIISKGLLQESFVPKRQSNKHINGQWKIVEEKLFPGYVFALTSDPDGLFLELKKVPKLSRLLHDREYFFQALSKKEKDFIMRIGGLRKDHTFGISKVSFDKFPYKKGDNVKWIDGDLAEFKGEIVGFDLHHRQAIVHTALFGGCDMHVGIEIIKENNQ